MALAEVVQKKFNKHVLVDFGKSCFAVAPSFNELASKEMDAFAIQPCKNGHIGIKRSEHVLPTHR